MTLEEVAAYLRLKPQTIYTWAQEKKIPAAKLGREWRFKKSIIDVWFLQHIDEKYNDVTLPRQRQINTSNNQYQKLNPAGPVYPTFAISAQIHNIYISICNYAF